MSKKEEFAKIFASGSKMPSTKLLRELSFMEGWDACLKYLGEIPWNEAMNEIVKHIENNRSEIPNSSKKEEDNEKKMVQPKGEGEIIELDTIIEYKNGQVYIKKMNTSEMPATLTFNLIEALNNTIVEYYKGKQ